MKKVSTRLLVGLLFVLGTMGAKSQNVTVNPGAGSYLTLKAAFDAINAGTHTGAITVSIDISTTEGTTPATLNSSGAGAASYTSVLIFPSVDGIIVSGNPATGFGVIQLKGADNVTIDGDNPNSGGINRNLTVNNTNTTTAIAGSVIRIATAATVVTSADNITIRNCILNGNVTAGNASGITSTTGSSNSSFGIYCGGNGGTTATDAPTAITSVTANSAPSGTTINNLTIDNNAVNQCARGIVFIGAAASVSPGTLTISNNVVGAAGVQAGNPPYTTPATTVYTKGIYMAGLTTASVTGNTLQNVMSYVGTTITGIEFNTAIGAGLLTVTGNSLTTIVNNAASSCLAISLLSSASGTYNISGNTLSGIWSAGSSCSGINCATAATSGTISLNNISTVRSRTTGGQFARGIVVSSGNAVTIQNNFISDVLNIGSASFSNSFNADGILLSGGINHKVYHNSINLFGVSTSIGSNSINCLAISASSQTGIDVRNNIFSNTVTGGAATDVHTCVFLPFTASALMLLNLNNNAYYTGAVAASGLGFGGATTFAAANLYTVPNFIPGSTTPATNWRSFSTLLGVATSDNSSLGFTSAAPFVSSTDLHISTGLTPTQLESGGATVGLLTDIDGQVRPGPAGSINGGAIAPDLGADEFDGVPLDLTPPNITYTPLGNTCTTSGVTLIATITDASGVPTAGIGLPVLYWRINAGAYTPVTAVSLGANQYQFNFGTGVVFADVVSYYIVAQDNAPTPNVGAFPSGGAGGYTANPPAAATPPTTPSSYSIQANLSGTYPVGVGQSGSGGYETITAAVAAYNTSCLTGPVIFSLTDPAYSAGETFPILINQNSFSSSTNTLTIKPAVGISPTISGATASNFLFRVSGNYIIFDGSNTVGGTTRDMTITNTSVTSPAALLYGSTGTTPLNGGTVKNTILINGSTTTSNIVVGNITSTTAGATAGYSTNFTFQNNSSRTTNFGFFMFQVVGAGNGNGTLITGNDFTIGLNITGISVEGVDGATITNNTIGGFDQVTNQVDNGIRVRTGTINTVVSNNSISNLGYSGVAATGNAYGIWVESANAVSNVTVSGNTISGFTSSGAASTVGTTGIYVSAATAGVTIENNIIRNMKNTNTTGFGASGIQLSSTSGTANIVVKNNMISDIAGYGKATPGVADNGYGIAINAGAGYGIYYNSINLNSNQTFVGGLPAAINITSGVSAAGAVDLRNNIFNNSQTLGTERYAIYSGATNTSFSNIDYNDYYTTGPNLGFIGVNRATLGDIVTGFGGNANSENVPPSFTSFTDLHLTPGGNAGLDGQGTPIGGITTDIDVDIRDITNPDIGADEFTGVAGLDMGVTALVSPAASGCYTATETVTVTIRNFSGTLIDFAVDNVTVNVTATGGYSSNVVLTSGTLAAGTNQNVSMPATIDLSVNGAYTFNANTVVAGDITPGNDAMAPAVRNVLSLGGTYTVGTGGNYTNLTLAVADYNAATCITGPIVFELISTYTSTGETFPIAINANAAAGTNTLTIRPASGQNPVITGSSTNAILKLNGADYVIIDGSNNGSSSRNLMIENTSVATNTAAIWVASLGTGAGATNNIIRNTNIKAGSNTVTSTFGIHVGGSAISTTGTGDDNDNLGIQNNSISKAYYGIYARAAATGVNDNLDVSNNSIGSATVVDYIGFRGLQVYQANVASIIGNTVFNIVSAVTNLRGMEFVTGFVNSSVEQNKIYNISNGTTTFSAAKGMSFGPGAGVGNIAIRNNVIYGLNGNGSTTATNNSWGIMLESGAGYNIYSNSVNLSDNRFATSSTDLHGAMYVAAAVTGIDLRNNVLVTTAAAGNALGKTYGLYSLAANTAFTNINYNDYWASGTNRFAGLITAIDRVTLADMQGGFGQNVNSLVADPLFNSNTNLVPQVGSPLSGAGDNSTGVTVDYLGTARGNPPTIGAYETAADALAPVITYTTLGGTCLTTDRILTATITDVTGVPTAGVLQPRIYYRKNAGAWFSSQGVLTSGTGTNGTWDFTIIAADMGGVANPDVISYYVIAQDVAAIPNIGSNPAAGLVATDVNTVSTPPTTPNTYLIQNTLAAGTYNVGAGQAYTTLTAAINAYNTSCLGGPIVFELVDATYAEAGAMTIAVNADASAINTLTIRPAVGVTAAVSATAASGAVIKILGNFITIDGSNNGTTSRDLTITNGSVTTPNVIWIGSTGVTPITDVTVKNSILVNGVNTSSAVVVSSGAVLGTAGYFNNITIENNSIQRAYMGVYSIAVVGAGNGSGLNIASNDLSTTGANAIRYIGFYFQGVDGATVQNNTIGNFDGVSSEDDKGIWLATGTVNSTVTKNRIFNLNYTGTSGYGTHGIYISTGSASANIMVSNNMIANLSGDGWSYTSIPTDNTIGILLTGAQNQIQILHNSINLSGNTLNQTDAMSMGMYLGAGSVVSNLRDNIIVNNLGLLAATGYGAVGIYAVTNNTQFTGIDYNDYVVNPTGSGNKFIGQIAATGSATIAAWRIATAQDVNSQNILPNFVSATDLHLVTTSNCGLDGTGIFVGITDDYDGDGRDVTTPDMGADEFTATYSGTLAGVAPNAVCENKTVSITGTTYASSACDLIARLLPSGADPVAGRVNVCVTLDATQQYFNGEPYVQRHFDLEPTTSNQTTTSATITLYFTDAEFALYNTNNPVRPPLPTVAGGGNADPFRANLKVTQFHGTATTSPSSPGNYTGVRVLILPTLANVFYNGSFWEITFDVAGFSGFYIHTNIFNAPLPISINYFTGSKQGSNHLLNWKVTCNSTPRATMTLERSGDSRNFSAITTITADAVRCNQPFDHTDAQPLKGMNYYRLKIVDDNGAVSYSGIVALLNAVKGFDIISIAPNPVVDDNFRLNITTAQSAKMDITIIDMQGRLVNRQTVAVIAGYSSLPIQVSNLAAGTYTIQATIADERSRAIRFVKQ